MGISNFDGKISNFVLFRNSDEEKFEHLSKSIYGEVKKVIPDEITPEEDLKKREAEAKTFKLLSEIENKIDEETKEYEKKRKLPEEVKEGIKDLKVNERGEGPNEGRDTN